MYIGKPYSLDEFKNEKFTSELSDEFTEIMREKMNESISEARKMEAEGKRKWRLFLQRTAVFVWA